ncbi:MAG: hypothetical protein J6S67_20930 [Methanobrevibacter sp.]|nr:hypothetical protein [Methanobrevibacter sp.]
MKTVTEALIEVSNKTQKKITYMDFARVLGCTKQYVSQIKNEELTPAQQEKIEKHYKVNLLNTPDLTDSIVLDYYPDMFGSCGNGVFELSPIKEQLIVPQKAFFTRFSPVKKYSVMNAYGNSMEPFIYDRDKLIIEHWEGEQIIDNRPYIFCYNNEIFIKRLVKNINQLVIVPENKLYDTIKLQGEELKDVHIIGQIVGLMRDLR